MVHLKIFKEDKNGDLVIKHVDFPACYIKLPESNYEEVNICLISIS